MHGSNCSASFAETNKQPIEVERRHGGLGVSTMSDGEGSCSEMDGADEFAPAQNQYLINVEPSEVEITARAGGRKPLYTAEVLVTRPQEEH